MFYYKLYLDKDLSEQTQKEMAKQYTYHERLSFCLIKLDKTCSALCHR